MLKNITDDKYKIVPVPFKPENPYNEDVFFDIFLPIIMKILDEDENIIENDTAVEVNMGFNFVIVII